MAKKTAARKKKSTTKKKAKKTTAAKKKASKKASKKAAKKPAKKAARKTTAARKKAGKKTAASAKKAPSRKREAPLNIQSQHVDFLSYKVDQLRKFYGEILEFGTETRDHDGLSYVLVTTSPSSTIGFMPPHPEMRGERPVPREPTLYFEVKNVERTYKYLSAKGVAFMGPPEEMPWGYRVLTTTDPEGRTIMLASKTAKKSRP